MPKIAKHARIPNLPHLETLLGAELETFGEELRGMRRDFVVDYQALVPITPPEIYEDGGRLWERVVGERIPRRVRFSGVSWIRREGLYSDPGALPPEHAARSLRAVLSWHPMEQAGLFSVFLNGSPGPERLMLVSRGCKAEKRAGEARPVEVVRDWSPAPLFRPGLIPRQTRLRQKWGGDPVRLRLGRRMLARRLFVGDLESQPRQRPEVDIVLNLGETPSRWAGDTPHPNDRWIARGEGRSGMSAAELAEEAGWVIERLRGGQRVLVHCVAGLNRSTSIACAVLILLEGLSAAAALARVREQHGWARPDDYHWLALQWLAKTRGVA